MVGTMRGRTVKKTVALSLDRLWSGSSIRTKAMCSPYFVSVGVHWTVSVAPGIIDRVVLFSGGNTRTSALLLPGTILAISRVTLRPVCGKGPMFVTVALTVNIPVGTLDPLMGRSMTTPMSRTP